MKQVKVEEKYTRFYYEATDGNRFETSEECTKWEKSAKCAGLTKYKEYVLKRVTEEELYSTGSEEYKIDIVTVPDDEAEKIILQLLYLFMPELSKPDNEANRDRYTNLIKKAKEDKDYLFIGRGTEYEGYCYFYPLDTLAALTKRIKVVCESKDEEK